MEQNLYESPARHRARLAVVAAAVGALAWSGSPVAWWRELRRTLVEPAAAPAEPLAAAVALLAWALVAAVVAAALLVLLGRLPGAAGRTADLLADRVVPTALRRTVRGAVGGGLALGVLVGAGGPALADDRVPDHPLSAPADPAPADPATADPAPLQPSPADPAPADPAPLQPSPVEPATAEPASPSTDVVVVAPGDSLWALAAEHLTEPVPGAAGPTDAQVAAAWPRWWHANREVVGDDPDLLLVGQRLVVPPSDARVDR